VRIAVTSPPVRLESSMLVRPFAAFVWPYAMCLAGSERLSGESLKVAVPVAVLLIRTWNSN
jgi:hypothetical protein